MPEGSAQYPPVEPAGPKLSTEVASGPGPPGASQAAPKPPALRYLGFRTTPTGREYSLRATDDFQTRLFVMVITHEDFASREARFQDGPDLCFAKLQRDLAAEPGLPAGSRLVVTAREFVEYRLRESRPSRTRSGSRA